MGLAAFVIAAAIHGLFHALAPDGARPVPSLAMLPWVVASGGVAAFLASAVTHGRRAKGVLSTVGVVLIHTLVGLAALCGVLASDPAFPFGPHYVESLALPGDRGTAYLYQGGLFCRQTVRRSPPGSPWSTHDEGANSGVCEEAGRLRWDDATGQVRIVGPDGKWVPGPKNWGAALDWRPH